MHSDAGIYNTFTAHKATIASGRPLAVNSDVIIPVVHFVYQPFLTGHRPRRAEQVFIC